MRRPRLFLSSLLILSLAACGDDGSPPKAGPSTTDVIRSVALQNRGIGLLERYDYTLAVAEFEEAIQLTPDWDVAQFHLGLAYLHAGNETRPRSRELMDALILNDPAHVHALFAAGLLAENAGDPDAAIEFFGRAYEQSKDAVIGAKLGTLLANYDQEDEAFRILSDVHARRPALVAPVNSLMLLHRRRGEEELATTFYDKLIALKGQASPERDWVKAGEEMRSAYGNLGPYSLALRDFGDPGTGAERRSGTVSVAADVAQVPELRATAVNGAPAYLGLAVFDYDGDGDLDMFVCRGSDGSSLLRNDGGLQFSDVTEAAGANVPGAYAAAAGELDVDPSKTTAAAGEQPVRVDLVVLTQSATHVLHNEGDGTFRDTTAEAGLADAPGGARAVLLFDADQEGDLDILLLADAGATNRLYANRGPGVFVDATADSGLAGDGEAYGPAIVIDADEDLDLDLLITRPSGPPVLSTLR